MTVIGGLHLADIRKVFCTMRIVQFLGRRIPHREGPVIIDDHSPELFPAGFGSKRRLDNAECTNQCCKYLFHRRLLFFRQHKTRAKDQVSVYDNQVRIL